MQSCAPAAPMATGACSLDEPQPKFSPPMTIGYFVFISPSGINLDRHMCVSLHYAGLGLLQKGPRMMTPASAKDSSSMCVHHATGQ